MLLALPVGRCLLREQAESFFSTKSTALSPPLFVSYFPVGFCPRLLFISPITMLSPSAIRRLHRDLLELAREPLPTVTAAPSGDDLSCWCANLAPSSGPYAGCVVHLRLKFPYDYPQRAPTVTLCADMQHPNVFGRFSPPDSVPYICLDLLKPTTGTPYSGWSTAYSISSILLQLQSFLLADSLIPQDYGGSRRAYVSEAAVARLRSHCDSFVCEVCGHRPGMPYPALPTPRALAASKAAGGGGGGEAAGGHGRSVVGGLPASAVSVRLSREVCSDGLLPSPTAVSSFTTRWQGVAASHAVMPGQRAFFEVTVKSSGPAWDGIVRVGWGCDTAGFDLGRDAWGIGYGGTGKRVYDNRFVSWGEPFGLGDTVTAAIDLAAGWAHFAKNGKALSPSMPLPAAALRGKPLFPMVAMRDAAVDVNFGAAELPMDELARFSCMNDLVRAAAEEMEGKEMETAEPAAAVVAAAAAAAAAVVPASAAAARAASDDSDDSDLDNNAREMLLLSMDGKAEEDAHEEDADAAVAAVVADSSSSGVDADEDGRHPAGPPAKRARYYAAVVVGGKAAVAAEEAEEMDWHELRDCVAEGDVAPPSAVTPRQSLPLREQALRCFHTRLTWKETLLGVGVFVQPAGRGVKMDITFDLLSHSAYKDEYVRTSVWGKHFTHFLPVALNEEHAARSTRLLPRLLPELLGLPAPLPLHELVLQTLPNIMNTLVVSLMLQTDDESSPVLFASTRALSGYCYMHHLLLHMASVCPELRTVANKRVEAFACDPLKRTKSHVPDLGQFLVLLSLADRSWSAIGGAVLTEMFDRNVKWLLQKDGGLDNDMLPQASRLRRTMAGARTSLRLLMFQVYFLCNVARPSGKSVGDVLADYNARNGVPSEEAVEQLSRTCKAILAVSDWPSFFHHIRLRDPGALRLNEMLVTAVHNSSRKGYHRHGGRRGHHRGGGGGASHSRHGHSAPRVDFRPGRRHPPRRRW
eukprot:PLAT12454.12.p1 GENE.PLAT12454.12~~PLAT12454.12.p1  ORF type:complete len:976 (-),score=421.42 PLAT12454.12:106-3033(-)